MSRHVRILACGTRDRGDDAAALVAAGRLPPAVRRAAVVRAVGQLSTEQLLGDEPGTVRLVLDCVQGLAAGAILDLPLADLPALEARLGAASTHVMSPGQAVALAASLGAVGDDDRFIGVGGAGFGLGAPLSGEVLAGIPELVRRVVARVAAVTPRAGAAGEHEPCA